MSFLENLCLRCLEEYDTTLEQDKNILEVNKELSFNTENCIKLRIGEKEVLKEIINFSKSVVKIMNYSPQVLNFF